MFFGPACRSDLRVLATEWFNRANRGAAIEPSWIMDGMREFFVTHYEEKRLGLDQDRLLRVVFYDNPVNLRRGRANLEMETLAVAYAMDEYASMPRWLAFFRRAVAGEDTAAAFEDELGISITEFYERFEDWADNEHDLLVAAAFGSCEEAGRSLTLVGDPPGWTQGSRTSAFPVNGTMTRMASCARGTSRGSEGVAGDG